MNILNELTKETGNKINEKEAKFLDFIEFPSPPGSSLSTAL
jgi:hypothetical protein